MPRGPLTFALLWITGLAVGVLFVLLVTGGSLAWLLLAVVPAVGFLFLTRTDRKSNKTDPSLTQVPEQRDIEG